MTIYKSVLAIFILPINLKIIAVVSAVLGTIINLIFLPSTVTVVVIM
jgi:hypothetical protein